MSLTFDRSSLTATSFLGGSSVLVLLLITGCQSALDKDRDGLTRLRESIGRVEPLRDEKLLVPRDVNPDEIAKLKDVAKQDEAINRLIKVLEPGSKRDLSIAECRQATLNNNLDLQAQFIDPQIAQEVVREQQAKFESSFDLSVKTQRTINPAYNYGKGASVFKNDTLSAVPTLNVPLRTGGTVSLDWTVGAELTASSESSSIATVSQSDITLEITQPLLRDAWMDYNNASIVLAQAAVGSEEANTQVAVISTLLEVESRYWSVYLAQKNLEIQIQIYKRTKSVLDDSREMVKKNQGSISSVYNFEVTLAQAVSAVINAELTLRTAVRSLKTLMQEPSVTLDSTLSVVTTSAPQLVAYDFNRTKLVDLAISNRGELLALEFEQVTDAINVLMAENQMLPEVDVVAGYTWNGLNSASRAIPVATRNLFKNNVQGGWQLGLSASVPLGNEAAIAAYQSALLTRLQSIANIRSREILVSKEVLDAVDTLDAGWQTILTTRYEVAAAQRNVDAMTQLFKIGSRTSTDLANAITLLAAAQSSEASAEANYQISFAQLAASVGCMLGHAGIEWGDYASLTMLESAEKLPVPIDEDLGDVERSELSDPDAVPNVSDIESEDGIDPK